MVGRGTHPFQIGERRGGTDAPLVRRPVGRLAATSARAWSGRTSHRRSAIVRSPAVPPSILGTSTSHQRQPLCVLCVFAVFLGGRLCASVSLCLCGFLGVLVVLLDVWAANSKFEIRNSKSDDASRVLVHPSLPACGEVACGARAGRGDGGGVRGQRLGGSGYWGPPGLPARPVCARG